MADPNMGPKERFTYEMARIVCRAASLEREGRRDDAADLRNRVEAACRAIQQRPSDSENAEIPSLHLVGEEAIETLGESIRMLCRAESLRRGGRREEADEFRLRSEAMMADFRAHRRSPAW